MNNNNTIVRGTDEDYLLINNIIKTSQMINAPGQEHATTLDNYYNKFLDMNSIDDLVQELHDVLRHKHDISDDYIRSSIELYVSYIYLGFKAENDIHSYLVRSNTNKSSIEFIQADKLNDSLYAIDIFMNNNYIDIEYSDYDDVCETYINHVEVNKTTTTGIQIKPYRTLLGFGNSFYKAVKKLENAKKKNIIEEYVFMFYYDDYIIAHKKRNKSRKASRYYLENQETTFFYTESEVREIMLDYSSIYELQQSNEFEFIPMTKPRKPKKIH